MEDKVQNLVREVKQHLENESFNGEKLVAMLYDKYERYWLVDYKGKPFIVYDPLCGFYSYVGTLEEFMKNEHLKEEELAQYYLN